MADGFGNPFLEEENESADPLENPFLEKKKDGFSNPFVSDLPAETAIPPVAAISEPSPITDMPPVDPTGGFRSPTSGVTETNALLAQQIADPKPAQRRLLMRLIQLKATILQFYRPESICAAAGLFTGRKPARVYD